MGSIQIQVLQWRNLKEISLCIYKEPVDMLDNHRFIENLSETYLRNF